jgi:hypothetical protein
MLPVLWECEVKEAPKCEAFKHNDAENGYIIGVLFFLLFYMHIYTELLVLLPCTPAQTNVADRL